MVIHQLVDRFINHPATWQLGKVVVLSTLLTVLEQQSTRWSQATRIEGFDEKIFVEPGWVLVCHFLADEIWLVLFTKKTVTLRRGRFFLNKASGLGYSVEKINSSIKDSLVEMVGSPTDIVLKFDHYIHPWGRTAIFSVPFSTTVFSIFLEKCSTDLHCLALFIPQIFYTNCYSSLFCFWLIRKKNRCQVVFPLGGIFRIPGLLSVRARGRNAKIIKFTERVSKILLGSDSWAVKKPWFGCLK